MHLTLSPARSSVIHIHQQPRERLRSHSCSTRHFVMSSVSRQPLLFYLIGYKIVLLSCYLVQYLPKEGFTSNPFWSARQWRHTSRGHTSRRHTSKKHYIKDASFHLPYRLHPASLWARRMEVFSKLDLRSANNFVRITKCDKMAFITPVDHFEYRAMPCEPSISPAVFQNSMNEVFWEFQSFVIVYINDVLIYSQNQN